MKEIRHILGLGKTKFNSSVCRIDCDNDRVFDVELILTERLNRKKCSGAWPAAGLLHLIGADRFLDTEAAIIGENRDVITPQKLEDFYDQTFLFYDYIKKNKLEKFVSKYNPGLTFISHHDAHAYAALAMSPFTRSVIVVKDGAGTNSNDHLFTHGEVPPNSLEECSVYLQDQGKLKLVHKTWITFKQAPKSRHFISAGIGSIYEKTAEFIFNSPTSSGKVMGLAPYGTAQSINDRMEFQNDLDWNRSFKGRTKPEWESSCNLKFYANLAATIQNEFENDYLSLIRMLKLKYPTHDNLILAGGCALNCTNNAKILRSKTFDHLYVLPFPGDESIGFGVAQALRLKHNPDAWKAFSYEDQSAYFGPKSSVPKDDFVKKELEKNGLHYRYLADVVPSAVADLTSGKIIGWFQGRSESGPRALGNRSILADASKKGLKDYLNRTIKFREAFRPYGCSTLYEKAPEYFEVDPGLNNPYMSYAIRVKAEYLDLLQEVTHVDGTSRMQIVRRNQNPLFYRLLKEFGDEAGHYCLLNTSLNVMGEPIVESVADAINFFKKTPVDVIYIGNFRLQN